jgi:hypothetical protein
MPPTGARSTIAAGAAAALLLVAFIVGASLLSIDLWSLINSSGFVFLCWAVVIVLLLYIAVRAKQWLERYLVAAAPSNNAADIAALRQSLERIEKKVDTIEEILENVAE